MKFLDRVDAVAKKMERFLSGSASADPLYLTNRTWGQKLRIGLLIGTPVLAIAALMYLAMNNYFDPAPNARKPAESARVKQPTGEITAKVLPTLEKEYTSEYSRDVDVLEAAVSRTGDRTLSGRLRNNTDHLVRVADIVFDVTDEEGSQLGGVSVRVENIAPRAIAPFKIRLEQQGARSALVREVHSH